MPSADYGTEGGAESMEEEREPVRKVSSGVGWGEPFRPPVTPGRPLTVRETYIIPHSEDQPHGFWRYCIIGGVWVPTATIGIGVSTLVLYLVSAFTKGADAKFRFSSVVGGIGGLAAVFHGVITILMSHWVKQLRAALMTCIVCSWMALLSCGIDIVLEIHEDGWGHVPPLWFACFVSSLLLCLLLIYVGLLLFEVAEVDSVCFGFCRRKRRGEDVDYLYS
mmetsp:Transcript_20435/g.57564  ORF Transcript_20435/g.57564 Transcript_20435/m.57564 type:complete len:221 (+) Transcript_20435:90-752(+)